MNSTHDQDTKAAKAIDIEFALDEDGNPMYDSPLSFRDVSWEEWITLPIRPYDEVIHGARINVRVPTIVMSSNYSKMPRRRLNPNRQRIFERDGYRCAYTGKRLPKSQLNIDHIIPRSRGGKNTWGNMVACWKKINTMKGDKTPEEAGLRLLVRPTTPEQVPAVNLIGDIQHPSWIPFMMSKN